MYMFLLSELFWHVQQTKEKGRGVFAKLRIPKGTVIGDYLGKVTHIADYDPNLEKGLYLLSFTNDLFIYPDLSSPGVYLLNHSCRPNAWMYIYHGHTLFFALHDITPGEEITISYLLSPQDESCMGACAHICFCGSEFCRGTMHLSPSSYRLWQMHLAKEKRKTTMASYTVGAYLSKLSSYPLFIPTDPIYEIIMHDTEVV